MIEVAAHIAAIGGSIATVFVAVRVFRLNEKMDRFIGRVEVPETVAALVCACFFTGAAVASAQPSGASVSHGGGEPTGALAGPASGTTLPVASEAGEEVVAYQAVLDRYCVACHNGRTLAGGLALDDVDLARVGPDAERWEKVLQKLHTRAMPPPRRPRPEPAVYDAFAAWLEGSLDQWAVDHPNPGRPPIHRLNRLEYANAVRDLLRLEIDAEALLPADDMAFGFDNNAAILTVAPGLFSRYMSAARTVSRLAVGDPSIEADIVRYPVSSLLAQDGRMGEDLPFGSRGGAAVRHHFPRDGDYVLRIELRQNRGRNEPQEIDVRVDGGRVALLRAGRWPDDAPAGSPDARAADEGLAVRFAARAGTRPVSVSFTGRTMVPEGVAPARLPLWTFSTGRGYVEPMALDGFEIEGPYDGETAFATGEASGAAVDASGAAAVEASGASPPLRLRASPPSRLRASSPPTPPAAGASSCASRRARPTRRRARRGSSGRWRGGRSTGR